MTAALPIRDAGESLRSGEVTADELARRALAAVADLDSSLAAFVVVDTDGALAAAGVADAELRRGIDRGPLHGMPVAVKDIIDVVGLPTRCGSALYPDVPAPTDAPVVARLRDAGAVIVGKTTAHELACGVYSSPASNPWNTDMIPGGSSGGSGAAVSAGIVALALGSDTGGSIRIPAALCGVAGLKPTYGLVPRDGVEPLSWSLDHIGPLGSTVEDCAIGLNALAGGEPAESPSVEIASTTFTERKRAGIGGERIGVLHQAGPTQPEVRDAFDEACAVLDRLGAELVEVSVPELDYTLAAEFGIVGPEAGAHHRERLRTSAEAIDPGIRALLVAGLTLPGDRYVKALQARAVIRSAVRACFETHHLSGLVTPTLPATAAAKDQTEFRYQNVAEDVTQSYVRTTAPFNLTGQPALSVPCGFDADGLPIGLQIAGRPFEDAVVLRIGAVFEEAVSDVWPSPPVHASSLSTATGDT